MQDLKAEKEVVTIMKLICDIFGRESSTQKTVSAYKETECFRNKWKSKKVLKLDTCKIHVNIEILKKVNNKHGYHKYSFNLKIATLLLSPEFPNNIRVH